MLLAACGTRPAPPPPPPPVAPAIAPAPPPAPVPIVLADLAGSWTVKLMSAPGDSTLLTYTMDAAANASGWTITLPGRMPLPIRIRVSGDSLVIDTGPYSGALRPGALVTTHGVVQLIDDQLVGNVVAHIRSGKSESVETLRMVADRPR